MKHLLPAVLLLVFAFAMSCANQSSPTGGPKDTIPPTLIHSKPLHKTVNYTGQDFTLTFDERVSADRIKQNLIITPYIENPYKFKVKKNTVILQFEEPFDSATTYTLNFAEGIGDITEKNPPVNLKLAFSTGPILDSIYLKGYVHDLYTNAPIKEALVSLYSEEDTIDAFTGKPRYFTKTDEEGLFTIENIKNGKYKLYAFMDANNNMKIEPSDELHGFKSGYIDLNQSVDEIKIPVQIIDSRELKLSRGKSTGRYFDVLYNKFLSKYLIKPLENKPLPLPKTNLISENQTIRFYKPNKFKYERDSLGLIIQVFDSLENNRQDTLYVKFKESKRKPATFEYTMVPAASYRLEDSLKITIDFTKPITSYSTDSISLNYDTLLIEYLTEEVFSWNQDFTKFHVKTPVNKNVFPDLIDSLLLNYQDTTNTDSIFFTEKSYLMNVDTSLINFNIPAAAFVSVENDTTKAITRGYLFKNSTASGIISGTITSTSSNFTLQLVDPSYKIIQSTDSKTTYKFKDIEPGKYTFRILIDDNADGEWSSGNIIEDIEPESIYFYPEVFDVRANWELENVNIQF
ncbi:Ig-like domain-containing domain [Reichenbachiella versicolor]|uniref:Ig-like domain-containing domain n=1 Tax=Reichenbachiella versicolor TaxID=1821036 RepID=UPI000D6E23C4|nr:Ig-like domain-containing domain [Reichenbachiella versicolor]